jgi:hypothetical protein
MLRRRRLWYPCLVAVALLVPVQAHAVDRLPRLVRLTATATLFPAFSPDVHDYVVRCGTSQTVRFTTSVADGTTSVIDGAAAHSAAIELAPDHAVTIDGSSRLGTEAYHVRCLPPDFPTWTVTGSGTPGEWYVATPSLSLGGPTSNYAAIFDSNGVPVWWSRDTVGPPIDATILPGPDVAYATFGAASGAFQVRTLAGKLVRKIVSPDGAIDVHELQFAANGDAVFLVYRPKPGVDLTPFGGPAGGTILEGEVEEVSPAGKLVWSWSTDGLVDLSESQRWLGSIFDAPVKLVDGTLGYDFFHANAVALDGNTVLVSLRQTDGIYAIDRTTGTILWKLGGTPTPQSLTVLGDPLGDMPLGGQHDIRVLPDGTITLFDDGTFLDRAPRALRYRVDPATHTATLLEQVTDPTVTSSACCGSARRLTNGDWVISWGGDPVVGEYKPDGTPVFRMTFGGVFSYRVEPVAAGRLSAAALRRGMDELAAR